ncbi:FUSC family protein [Streptomyces albireticuli]|uniref:FUSC family protein n=1 Tax=Streptomyces albireticuli TaxID=1940 RepID=UPI0014733556
MTGALACTTAWFLPFSHAVWLATSALRVAKPGMRSMRGRVRERVWGTAAGGGLAALLLSPAMTLGVRAAVIAAVVCVMQLVGAARYGWRFGAWSLCFPGGWRGGFRGVPSVSCRRGGDVVVSLPDCRSPPPCCSPRGDRRPEPGRVRSRVTGRVTACAPAVGRGRPVPAVRHGCPPRGRAPPP